MRRDRRRAQSFHDGIVKCSFMSVSKTKTCLQESPSALKKHFFVDEMLSFSRENPHCDLLFGLSGLKDEHTDERRGIQLRQTCNLWDAPGQP